MTNRLSNDSLRERIELTGLQAEWRPTDEEIISVFSELLKHRQAVNWNFNSQPVVELGEKLECWVCIKSRADNLLVIQAYFINCPYIESMNESGDIPDWALSNDDEPWADAVGWHSRYDHCDYSGYYEALDIKVYAWAPVIYPNVPHAAITKVLGESND